MAPGTTANFRRISANDENITELELNIGQLVSHQKKGCGRMGRAIGNNTQLKKLALTFPPDETVERLRAFWRGLIYNDSIEEIKFDSFPVVPERDLGLFMQFFQNNSNLKSIIFDNGFYVDRHFEFICSALRSCESLKNVTINSYYLSMERFLELSNFLAGLPWLERISLCKQDQLLEESPSLSNALKGLILQMNQSALRELNFVVGWGIVMNDDLLLPLANSLKSNTRLEKLKLTECHKSVVSRTRQGWIALEEALCHHNDTFHEFSFAGTPMPPKIRQLLSLNKNENKKFVRFRKGIDYDFLLPEPKFNEEPFGEDFDDRLLPYVLSSIGSRRNNKDHRSQQYRQSALFYFVKSMPELVVATGKNAVEANGISKRRTSARIAGSRKKKCSGT